MRFDAALAELRKRVAAARGTARHALLHELVVALHDRLAFQSPDEPLIVSQRLVDEPRFGAYAKADEVLLLHSKLLFRAGRGREAREVLVRLVTDYPGSALVPDAYLEAGEQMFASRQFVEARKAYELVQRLPAARLHLHARYMLARIDVHLSNFEEAMRGFEVVVSRDTSALRLAALGDLESLYAQREDPARARAYFERVDPGNGLAHLEQIARHYVAAGKHPSARTLYLELAAAETDPTRVCLARVAALEAAHAQRATDSVTRDAEAVLRVIGDANDTCRQAVERQLTKVAVEWHGKARDRASARASAEMWFRVRVTVVDPRRRDIVERNLAVAKWDVAQRARTSALDWLAAGEALQDSRVAELAAASLDAYDNALRIGVTKLGKPGLARLRAGLARHSGDRARRLLGQVR